MVLFCTVLLEYMGNIYFDDCRLAISLSAAHCYLMEPDFKQILHLLLHLHLQACVSDELVL